MSSELSGALEHLAGSIEPFQGDRSHIWRALRSLGPALQSVPIAMERLAPPYAIAAMWAQDLRSTRARNIVQLSIVVRAIEVLQNAGIDHLVFKGADAVERFYPDLGMRPMDDADILVRGDENVRAIALLLESGFVRVPSEPGRFGPSSTELQAEVTFRTVDEGVMAEIDLHWHTVADARLRAGFPGIEDASIWDRTMPGAVGRTPVLRLGDIDAAIVQSVSQIVGHPWSHPLGYLDLHLLVSRWRPSEWDGFIARVKERNLSVPVFWALRFVTRLFGTSVPDWSMALIQPSRRIRWATGLLIQDDYWGLAPFRREMAARDLFVLINAQPDGAFRMLRHGLFWREPKRSNENLPIDPFGSARACLSIARVAIRALARGAAR